ncbi:hypothetical protein [Herbiconiux solani]|uniref:hypothetical protein n=1 Tax=Herbiconiux solani TaxID=661329 RepID=UPI0008267604|nr:hypothetical protein [Herbiconiux solani]
MSDPRDPDSTLGDAGDEPFFDRIEAADEADELVTNDAVAGETVDPGLGEGNDGPTGGSPKEGQPDWSNEAPGQAWPDESQPFGDRTPDDLRGDDPESAPGSGAGDGPDGGDWTEQTV